MKFTIYNYMQFDTFNDIKFAIKLHDMESQTVKCYHFHKYSAQCVILFRLIYHVVTYRYNLSKSIRVSKSYNHCHAYNIAFYFRNVMGSMKYIHVSRNNYIHDNHFISA